MLSEKSRSAIRDLMANYPDKRSAVMPALHLAQREIGWLPSQALQDVADEIGLSKTEVGSVASFYTMFALEKPGKHTVYFCTDLPCALRGAEQMMEHLEHRLGCKAGQTSADGQVTLHEAECLGGCDHAPVMLVDGIEHRQDLTNDKIDEIVDHLRSS